MATICTEQRWKNRRKRSLYTREGRNGFIYRNLNDSKEASNEPVTDGGVGEGFTEETLEAVEELRSQVEVERFLSELRKGIVAAETTQTEEQLDESFRQLAQELTANNLYVRCLEEVEVPKRRSQEHIEEETQRAQLLATITDSIERYERESEEWATVCEERRQVTEQAKEGYSKERHLNFLKLPARDVEPLKSFLSPGQLALLESEVSSTEFVSSTTQELDSLEGKLDQELARLSSLGGSNHQTSIEDRSMLNCTPRTLFGALKNTDPNQTIS